MISKKPETAVKEPRRDVERLCRKITMIACIVLAPVPLFLNNAYTQFVINVMMINIILAVGLNIVKGFAGQVTVGHVALMAIGAYASAVVSVKFGFPFWIALPTAMLITAAAGALSASLACSSATISR